MSRFQKGLTYLVILIFCTLIAGCSDDKKTETITILHFNDVYEISPIDGKGGLAELMTLIKQQRSKYPNSITVVSGDFLFPSVMSSVTNGKHMIHLFNELGVDLVVFGNHEFDYGPQVLLERMPESKFTWLGANVWDRNLKYFGGAAPFDIRTMGKVKAGFFGVISPESAKTSKPGDAVKFGNVVNVSRKITQQLKKQGAQVIIALTHMDFTDDVKLALEVEDINLILGGHDHDPITWEEAGVLIQKSGTEAHYLGVIHLKVLFNKDGVVKNVIPEWSMLSTSGIKPDPKVKKIVDQYRTDVDQQLKVKVGTTLTDLDSRRFKVRSQESTMGNLITDVIREYHHADVGVFNGGGIRGNRLYPAGSEILKYDIMSELPFSDHAILIELKGDDLRNLLGRGVSEYESKKGRFLQVSGISIVIEPKKQVGERVKTLLVNGKELDLEKTYRVAIGSYIANGGDGYTMLKKAKRLINEDQSPILAQLIIDYIESKKEISPEEEKRIIIIRD